MQKYYPNNRELARKILSNLPNFALAIFHTKCCLLTLNTNRAFFKVGLISVEFIFKVYAKNSKPKKIRVSVKRLVNYEEKSHQLDREDEIKFVIMIRPKRSSVLEI